MTIKPNLALLRDAGTDGAHIKWKVKNKIAIKDPFCLKFKHKNKTLFYIGAVHTFDPKSLTYSYIKNVLKKNKINIVLLEGIPFNEGISPNLSYFQGEGLYASTLAQKNAIPYSGVEPLESKVLLNLTKVYKKSDIYAYIYLRTYKYFCYTMKEPQTKVDKIFTKYELPMLKSSIGEIQFDFKKWFERTLKRKFVYGEDLELSSPHENSTIVTQRIASDFSKMRDKKIVTNLYKFINQYDNVLFICGQNHVYAQMKVLERTFGKGVVVKN